MAYVPPHKRLGRGESNSNNHQQQTLSNSVSSQQEQADLSILFNAFTRICCINLDKRVDKWRRVQREAKKVGTLFHDKVERFSALEGRLLIEEERLDENDVCRLWDATSDAKYNRHVQPEMKILTPGEVGCALSHIQLWRQLAESNDETMLILEDDCTFAHSKGRSRFARVVSTALEQLPDDWALFYLGLSDRGERAYLDDVTNDNKTANDKMDPSVRLYRPYYGYQTHAYAIRKATAEILLRDHLPIQGPIDVWLAENHWFDLPVYSAVIANEGWKLDDGTYEGLDLVMQQKRGVATDIDRS
jgi:GR25 family glycosyltransferase involved in LPS biosynthesis